MAEQLPDAPAPIIIVRKKGGHGGHHGGAWKVAYADFVTAMMALFIVLWLMNANPDVKKAVSIYFTDPSGVGKMTGSASAGSGDAVSVSKDNMKQLQEKIQQAMKKSPEFEKLKDHVRMTVTGEGLRIELLESEKGMFFQSGSGSPSELGKEILVDLARELGKLPNPLLIEGHTDSKPFGGGREYSNWELSADRANTSRRVMEANGLRPGQVSQVRGYADRQLRNAKEPEDASNRRVTIIIKYLTKAPGEDDGKVGAQGKSGSKKGQHEAAPAAKKESAEHH
ncbi:MAG: flagellar motor protein MotB [Bryobacteraceae bacterium]